MSIDEVIAIFLKLAELSESERGNYQNLCEDAVRSLRARLKSDINEEECGDSLNRAAAALAFIDMYSEILQMVKAAALRSVKLALIPRMKTV